MRVARLIVVTGCLQSTALVKINADGSGTIENQTLMAPAALAQMRQLAGLFGGTDAKPVDPFSEQQMRDLAAQMGEGVTLLSTKPLKTATGEGREAIYGFRDITKVRVSATPASPGGTSPWRPAMVSIQRLPSSGNIRPPRLFWDTWPKVMTPFQSVEASLDRVDGSRISVSGFGTRGKSATGPRSPAASERDHQHRKQRCGRSSLAISRPCGFVQFLAQRADAKLCSNKCRQAYHRRRAHRRVGENVQDIDEGSGIRHRRLEANCGGLPRSEDGARDGTGAPRRGEMRKLRHASREQEYRRDVEMREAVKAAEERALRAWRDSRPHFPFAKEGHQTTKGMGTGAWFLMGLENSNPRRRARGTRSIRIFFGCAGS